VSLCAQRQRAHQFSLAQRRIGLTVIVSTDLEALRCRFDTPRGNRPNADGCVEEPPTRAVALRPDTANTVPSTFLVAEGGGRIVGRTSIRHRRDRRGQSVGEGLRLLAAPEPGRAAYQHGVGCRGEHGCGDRVGLSPGRCRDREGDHGLDFGLLADLVLSAGVGRAGGAVGQRPRGKYVPGRPKTDKLDSLWLDKLTEKGLLRPSFVPAAPIRALRDYTRLRVDLTRERSRYWQRLEKLLEDALIKVSCVASTLDTLSVRDMLDALIASDRDPRRPSSKRSGRVVLGPPSLGAHGNGEFYRTTCWTIVTLEP
jgi:hypothetical protein